MELEKELHKLKNKVEHILAELPPTRNSDVLLCIRIWQEFYPELVKNDSVNIYDLFKLPREEHICRIRRKIQHDQNKYLPTNKDIARQRNINMAKWTSYMQSHFYSEKHKEGQLKFA
jgi:hypothetical protein